VGYTDSFRYLALRLGIADEKEILMKARYEMLAKEGGQRAVKKAIEKRQKKTSQKEKRSRPYLAAEGQAERPRKRSRVV